MRRRIAPPFLAIALALAACNLPLIEGPTPFPVQVEPGQTPTKPPEATPPTPPPDPDRIHAGTLGELHLVGEFPQDLAGALDWSPEGSLLAITTVHGSGVFDVQRLLKLRALLSDVTPTSLAFSPDSRRLVTGGRDIPESPQDTVTIWQVSDGSKLQTMIGHSEWVNAVDYSPTGEFVASGSDDATVRLWRVEDGTEAMVLRGHSAPVTAVAFAPDGQLLASGSLDGSVRLWRVSDGGLLRELAQGELGVTSVAFSPDGITLAVASADGLIRLFAAGTGSPLRSLSGNEQSVTDIDFSPDGSLLASSGQDHSLRFWQVSTGTQLHILAAHNAPVLRVRFSPDGRLIASASVDGSVRIWGLGQPLSAAPTAEPVADPIQPLAAGTELILQQIHMFSAEQGWAIGGAGGEATHLFRTEDGGESWLETTPPQSAQPVEGFQLAATGAFHDAYTGWVVYFPRDFVGGPNDQSALQVWRTSDGGVNWAADRPQAALDLNEQAPMLAFADDRYGWMLVEYFAGAGQHAFTLLRTSDSGFRWEAMQQPPETLNACHKTGLAAADADHGWITEDCPPELGNAVLQVSSDGGATLAGIPLPPPASDDEFLERADCQAHSPRLFAPGRGLLAIECSGRSGGFLYRTEDDGRSWRTSGYPGGSLQFLDERVGWALSRRIYKTVDGGATWVLVKTVNWVGRFSFASGEQGWAIATNNGTFALVRTTDGAQRWTLLEPVVAP